MTEVRVQVRMSRASDGAWHAHLAGQDAVVITHADRAEALARALAMALRGLAQRVERGELAGDQLLVRCEAGED